jgi:hypothetical protein
MDAILLRSLPVSDPESLVVLNWHSKATRQDSVMRGMSGTTYDDPELGTTAGIFPFPAFELFSKHDSVFSAATNACESWAGWAGGSIVARAGYVASFLTMSVVSLLSLPLLRWLAPVTHNEPSITNNNRDEREDQG